MPSGTITVLGIESSCDETAAAVLVNGVVRSNCIAGQEVHRAWGGVVPELASRAHQEHIVPVVDEALRQAGISKEGVDVVAFTQGPGLMGALLIGTCFARSLAQALGKPLVAVDHLKAHVLAHFIQDEVPRPVPEFPFINLTVSGGHTQLILVHEPLRMEIIGTTLDDAAGEAFDKGAKVMGLPYPGGPEVDRMSVGGDAHRLDLPVPAVKGLDMSFSGIKTAFAQHVRKGVAADPGFLDQERAHLCASLQRNIVDVLLRKLQKAGRTHGITRIGISGGVSANSALRAQAAALAQREGWELFIPPPIYCTDNAAMIAMAGHFMHTLGQHAPLDSMPVVRW